MNKMLKYLKVFLRNFILYLLGIIAVFGVLIIILISLPMYLYRWIICKLAAPLWGGDSLRKAITVNGAFFATELRGDSSKTIPKCMIVSSCTFVGAISLERLRDMIDRGWINAKKGPQSDELLYPEFQQYVKGWMGFMFWKQDPDFRLDNHLVHHKCEEEWTEGECETFVCSTVEELLNKPFPKGRSPWEVHLINGYRNGEVLPGGQEMSVMLFRFHHCLGDGFSIFQAILEGLFGMPLKECGIAAPSTSKVEQESRCGCLSKSGSCISFIGSILYDLGFSVSLTLIPTKTHWWIPEGKKAQLAYGRSRLIPISKIKLVKNKFGVGFTSVLLSSIGLGVAHAFEGHKKASRVKKLPFGLVVPLGDHPINKMRNHATGAILEIPVGQELSPLDRLRKAEGCFQRGRHSSFPAITAFMLKLTSSQISPICHFLLTNRTFPTNFTNFPGAGVRVERHGLSLVTKDFAIGPGLGVPGVTFSTLSYCDHIRLAVTADEAALTRQELEEMIEVIFEEIDKLYELAMKEDDVVIKIRDSD